MAFKSALIFHPSTKLRQYPEPVPWDYQQHMLPTLKSPSILADLIRITCRGQSVSDVHIDHGC